MERDGLSEEDAKELVEDARKDLWERLYLNRGDENHGDDLSNFCEEWFGLEPDYLDELL
jgi:hypothetical protein